MLMVVKVLGILIVVFGVMSLLKPGTIKEYISFWKEGKRLYWGGALSLLIGIMFLFAANKSEVPWFIVLFGLLSLAKGVYIFVAKQEKLMSLMNLWAEKSDKFLRTYSIVILGIGVLLITCA